MYSCKKPVLTVTGLLMCRKQHRLPTHRDLIQMDMMEEDADMISH